MFARTTRLELFIVAVALLVLLFCSRPPRSGNADTRPDATPPAEELRDTEPAPQQEGFMPSEPPQSPADPLPTAEVRSVVPEGIAPENLTTTLESPQPGLKRIGIVDARNCSKLNYEDVMVGEVTVRWVWDGNKLVPQKVCKVTEQNGVTSVWSFDGRDDIVLSEIEQE